MKVLILGANGMLGHKLYQVLTQEDRLDVCGTIRGVKNQLPQCIAYINLGMLELFEHMETCRDEIWYELISGINPDVVINCIGIIDKGANAYDMLRVNSLFPLQLKLLCANTDTRLIHISTDCVFSGDEGGYTEGSPADATDVYGKTKYLGEVTGDNVLTIRTSIIGRETVRSRGLLEWFISNRGGTVNGYDNAIFSGFPTVTFAGIIKDIILNHPGLHGLYHIAAEPINKYALLSMIDSPMDLGIKIVRLPAFRCDRSLNATKFNKATGFKPRPWGIMLDELAKDAKQYEAWR